MAWVTLSTGGVGDAAVIGVFGGPQPGNPDVVEIDDDDPRIDAFLNPPETAQHAAMRQLLANDDTMFRALEVLIDILLAKGTVLDVDFPSDVFAMYQARQALRVTAGVP